MDKYPLQRLYYSVRLVGREAKRFLDHATGQRFPAFRRAELTTAHDRQSWSALKKLHVGCGSTLLSGYINVDLPAESESYSDYAGTTGEILRTPMHDLSMFKSESVDVIETYHAIEHLPSWEAELALHEFFRVLKPGGELLIECPDLDKTCLNYLLNPEALSLGLNGLFSEQESKLNSMVHKYGYSPKSLGLALVKAGFGKDLICEIPARRYRQRDLRLLAWKAPFSSDRIRHRVSDRVQHDTVLLYGGAPARQPVGKTS